MLKWKIPNNESKMTRFCEKMELSSKRRKKLHKINDFSFILGTVTNVTSLKQEVKNVLLIHDIDNSIVRYSTFKRLYQGGIVYDSKSYNRKRRTNSSLVKYELDGSICTGIINTFVKVYV